MTEFLSRFCLVGQPASPPMIGTPATVSTPASAGTSGQSSIQT